MNPRDSESSAEQAGTICFGHTGLLDHFEARGGGERNTYKMAHAIAE